MFYILVHVFQSTDYGNFLSNESSLQVSVIDEKLREKFVVEFQHMRNHASGTSTGSVADPHNFNTDPGPEKIRYGPGPNFDTDPGKNDTDPYPGYQENLKNSMKTIIFYVWCVYCLTTIFLYDMITGMVII